MPGAGSCRRGEALQGITSFPCSAPLTPSTHRDLRDSGPGDLQSWSRVTPGLKSMGEVYQEKQ